VSSFEETYRTGRPPWDTGTPQGEIVALLDEGLLPAPILDFGCGTGENSLACAARGLEVHGLDGAPTAIARAKEQAVARGLRATFEVGDALSPPHDGRSFRTVIDSGLFHVFSDEDRPRYAASLFERLAPGGEAFLVSFSDAEPNWGGPRRVRRDELESTFAPRFEVVEIREARFDTIEGAARVRAWRTRLRRPQPPSRS
jgi:cyclopropane fatty-acyl-phospholipid synthase-like methyltransferase